MELLWDRRTKVSSNDPGHMTKLAAMLIYGNRPAIMFQSKSLRFLKNVQSKRVTTIFQKCCTRCATSIFFFFFSKNAQPFFCIRHCYKHDSTACYQINIDCKQIIVYNVLVAHICTMIRFLKYFNFLIK